LIKELKRWMTRKMLFKLLSGDVIDASSVEELADTLGVPVFRVHIEGDNVLIQDHPHECQIDFDGEKCVIHVWRYEGGIYHHQTREEEEEKWDWAMWSMTFAYRSGHVGEQVIDVVPEDMPEDTMRYVIDEVSRYFEEAIS
jgi:hypothetical protein